MCRWLSSECSDVVFNDDFILFQVLCLSKLLHLWFSRSTGSKLLVSSAPIIKGQWRGMIHSKRAIQEPKHIAAWKRLAKRWRGLPIVGAETWQKGAWGRLWEMQQSLPARATREPLGLDVFPKFPMSFSAILSPMTCFIDDIIHKGKQGRQKHPKSPNAKPSEEATLLITLLPKPG